MKLSIIVPAYKDPLLQKTIDSLLENSRLGNELEVLPVLDGYQLSEPLKRDSRVRVIPLDTNRGMRGAINAGIAEARGDFIMKSDSHCLFGLGYDKTLIESCAENWLMIPRRYSLNDVNWERNESRPIWDYHYFCFPHKSRYGYGMFVGLWKRGHERWDPKYDIDDTMAFQGSCWVANRKYYMRQVGFLDDRRETYGSFAGDQVELGLKYWLNGGEIKINKKVWYAHLVKVKHHYREGIYHKTFKNNRHTIASHTWTAKHWINNEEPNMKHPFSWLIEKFAPIPTWPENWREIWRSYGL